METRAQSEAETGAEVLYVDRGIHNRTHADQFHRRESNDDCPALDRCSEWICRAADFVLLEDVKTHHLAGMEFKLHPQRTTASSSSLQKLHEELSGLALQVWLWLESHRLNCAFHTVRNYALSPVPKCPETKHWRNCLINLRTFGPGILFSGQATRYPRERLLEALSLLLWEPETLKSKALLQHVQRALRTSAETFPPLLEAYRSVWHQFN